MLSNTRNLQRANSYEDCLDLFAKISKPRGSGWSENERPLGSKYQRHYRVERRYNGDWFDVILYHTTMARFYKPEADGSYRVQYSWDSRTTSSQFMHHVVHVNQVEMYRTKDGERKVPIGPGELSTDLWITPLGTLDMARSHHSQVYVPKVSEEFKAWRKAFRENLSNICFLLEQTVPEVIATHTPDANDGHPFQSSKQSTRELRHWDGETLQERVIEHLRTMYAQATRSLMDKREYKATPRRYSWRQKELADYVDPTPQEVTRSVLALLEAGTWAPKRHDAVPLPMFPTELPKNWTF